MRAAVIAQREMGWRLGLALIPHPQPFSLREKGVNLPSPLVGEGLGVRASLPSPLVGEGLVRIVRGETLSIFGITPLSPCGRGAGGEGITPLSPCGRGVGGEGITPLSPCGFKGGQMEWLNVSI